ncbi:MAG: sigma-70 family RNA polymerase sigma factor [Planctomycetes bacterium]|nr:sigma-70 family RNA polymerase sigma factor [Planctomycetota bacterium]
MAAAAYESLREIARAYARREGPSKGIQPSSLVNDAYLRLASQRRIDWKGKTHFLAVAAREMRRILVDRARWRRAKKHGGSLVRVSLNEASAPAEEGRLADVLDLEAALQELSALDPRAARVVELRFFGGLSTEESALVLGVSPRTVRGDWQMARAWLRSRLQKGQA